MNLPTYLLDTNMLSAIIKQPTGEVAQHLLLLDASQVTTSIIVACELRFGAAKKNSLVLTQRVEQLLAIMTVYPLEPDADKYYGQIRADLERKGQLIGQNDLLIAAHALALDVILVTDNVREFARVLNLKLENWLNRTPN